MMTRRIELSPRLRLAADLVPKGPGWRSGDRPRLSASLSADGGKDPLRHRGGPAGGTPSGRGRRRRSTAVGTAWPSACATGLGIREETETHFAVIAGMGGETIAQIPGGGSPGADPKGSAGAPAHEPPGAAARPREGEFPSWRSVWPGRGTPLCCDAGGGGEGAPMTPAQLWALRLEPGPAGWGSISGARWRSWTGRWTASPGERYGRETAGSWRPRRELLEMRGVGRMAAVTERF